jgi:diacylglycerol kinase (ATP)
LNHPDHSHTSASTSDQTSARATKRVTVLYNPFAGKGAAQQIALAATRFVTEQRWTLIDCAASHYAGHIESSLAASAAQSSDLIILIGGDGTLRELVNGLIQTTFQPEISFIPIGNANVVARELSIPLIPIQALQMLTRSKTVAVDIGLVTHKNADQEVHQQIFLAMLEIGIGARIVHLVDRLRQGKMRTLYRMWGDLVYALAGLLAFTGNRHDTVQGTTYTDNNQTTVTFRTGHLIVANMRTYAKGWSFTPDADCRDGLLDIAYALKNTRLAELAGFMAAANKRKQSLTRRHYSQALKITLQGSSDLFMQIDGDPVIFEGTAEVSLLPDAFIIHTPAAP